MQPSSQNNPVPYSTSPAYTQTNLQFISDLDPTLNFFKKLKIGLINGQYVEVIMEIWESVKMHKINYLSFVDLSISLITISVPHVGITVPFLNLFFSEFTGNYSALPIPDIFTAIIYDTQNMFNQNLTTDQENLNTMIKEFKQNMENYKKELVTLEENSEVFFDTFDHTDKLLTDTINQFIVSDYTQLHTPYFAIFATIHLMIHRDVIIHGGKWGFSDIFIHKKRNNIKKLIQKYLFIGSNLFKKELDNLLASQSELEVHTLPSHIQKFPLYIPNIYRLWPSLDPNIYPNYTELGKTELLLVHPTVIIESNLFTNNIHTNDNELTSMNANISSYLNSILPEVNNKHLHMYAPREIPSENIIGTIDVCPDILPIKITSLSIVNYDDNQGETVTEWINGGSIVKLQFKQVVTVSFINLYNHAYQIRLRYATEYNKEAIIWVCIRDNQTGKTLLNSKLSFSAPTDSNSIQGEYGKYIVNIIMNGEHDTKKTTVYAGSYTIFIKNLMEENLFLDRLEFCKKPIKNNTLIVLPTRELNSPPAGGIGWTNLWIAECNRIGTAFEAVTAVAEGEYRFYYKGNLVGVIQGTTFYENFDTVQIYFHNCVVNTINLFTGANIWTEDDSQECFKNNEDLKKIRKQVNSLFIENLHKNLKPDITDYWIDHVALKVDSLSDEIFGKEKKELRKLINYAKRLSKTRNLLIGGNFEKLDNWYLGRKVVRIEGEKLFKGYHILIPPPIEYPSYVYQKIDEDKLKENTRYIISGFIAQANHLNIVVNRYGNEINHVLNVLNIDLVPTIPEALTNSCIAKIPLTFDNKRDVSSNFFSYSIHVGSLQKQENIGIELGLRITKPTGFAKVNNIEIYEERPLTNQEIRKIKYLEAKWKHSFTQSESNVIAQLEPVLQQINALYQNSDWNKSIRSTVMFQDVRAIKLPHLPKQKHWFMEDRTDVHHTIIQQMQTSIQYAFSQLNDRNILQNGNFTDGLIGWIPDGNVQIILSEELNKVISLSHWDASITQLLDIPDFNPNQEYQIRIYGKGNGTIMIQHGNKIEVIHFSSKVFMSKPSRYMTFETAAIELYIVSEGGEFIIDNIQLTKIPLE
ncbi:hypothetical protein BK703_00625 [Bacillus thuringiensis serovar silo]|uniref:insecticidal delta-endotoxin Cry8Ea1 family protein n=1 Tax=Bacillus thuringiensis TaxID=1428 RepID=UPI0001CADF17|nr:insecticidal delta-endotoxin Cry8Ea1 family protein [Bacillus thuringiensis]MED3275800.1 insecticidal delta-endotoxin Cry8Ea1 family protein [Bacillus thuringiensis]OTW63423.1 hypothetical protein BK703_00625 [Bacillus thuringiensis serovar silo]OTW73723.1 hypothetical protein BK700_02190 [Bacillus thuringiensis serovar toguchini]